MLSALSQYQHGASVAFALPDTLLLRAAYPAITVGSLACP